MTNRGAYMAQSSGEHTVTSSVSHVTLLVPPKQRSPSHMFSGRSGMATGGEEARLAGTCVCVCVYVYVNTCVCMYVWKIDWWIF